MKYTEEMILHSPSGYCMPFEEENNKEVTLSTGYGEQQDAMTGETYFHHGITFNAHHRPLVAVASGTVSGIGNDKGRGLYLIIRYGKYEVTYAGLFNLFVRFGQAVKAGQIAAVSGNDLYMEVSFAGEELNPIEFLTMLYGNIQALRKAGHETAYEFVGFDGEMKTKYDRDKEEIEELMIRFLPAYMRDLLLGEYIVPEYTEQSLRNVFSTGAAKNYFFETMPSMANPLGIGSRALPLASKVQNLLIADFLNYLALRHNVYLSTLDEEVKKKLHAEAVAGCGIIDPLTELEIDVQSFDIPRLVSVYPDRAGVRWWTKAWFNNREEGEQSVEIDRSNAIRFIQNQIEKDEWLEEFFPKQMEIYHHAIEQTKEQLLNQLNY